MNAQIIVGYSILGAIVVPASCFYLYYFSQCIIEGCKNIIKPTHSFDELAEVNDIESSKTELYAGLSLSSPPPIEEVDIHNLDKNLQGVRVTVLEQFKKPEKPILFSKASKPRERMQDTFENGEEEVINHHVGLREFLV